MANFTIRANKGQRKALIGTDNSPVSMYTIAGGGFASFPCNLHVLAYHRLSFSVLVDLLRCCIRTSLINSAHLSAVNADIDMGLTEHCLV